METSGDGFGQKVNGKVKTLKGQSCKAKHCRFIQAKKVEVPDVVMAIHPHLEGEFWGPTVDLLLDENVVTGVILTFLLYDANLNMLLILLLSAFTAFNEEHFKQALERLDYVFAKYIFKVTSSQILLHENKIKLKRLP